MITDCAFLPTKQCFAMVCSEAYEVLFKGNFANDNTYD